MLASLRFGLDGSILEAGEGFFGWVWLVVLGDVLAAVIEHVAMAGKT